MIDIMMILHGDYRDLNHVRDYESGKPDNVSIEEMEELKPFWDMFINGKLNLTEGRIKNNEYLENVKIFIHHYIFEKNEYTTYSIVKAEGGGSEYIVHCKCHDRKFIDRENGVVIMESTEVKGKIPKTLEDVKEREIAFHVATLNRIKSADFEGKELAIELEEESIEKWKNKTETRWFY